MHLVEVSGFAALHLLALVLLAGSAYAAGRWLAWDLAWHGPAERAGAAVALGLAALASLGFLLGIFGQLARWPTVAVLLAVNLLAWRAWRELAGDVALLRRLPRRRLALAVGGGVAALAPSFLLALYPPTAFDATLYHLPFARAFARSGGLPWLPELRFPVFPQLSEVLFAGMLLLAGDVAAHLVELAACLATAALLGAWGREAFSPAAGWLAAAAYLGNPVVVHLGATAYIEPGLALFATASLYGLWRWRGGGGHGWLALAGAFAGAAAAVKYLGLFFVALGGLVVLVERWRGREGARPRWRRSPRDRWRDAAVYAAAALVVLLPWYGRILFHTGNPVFPFLPGVFGASPWQPHRYDGLLGSSSATALAGWASTLESRLAGGLGRLATLPWDWSFRRSAMGGQPPVSPFYLGALPLLVWAAVGDRRVREPLLVALAWTVVFLALPPDVRYLLPALALLSLALGGALDGLASRLPWGETVRRRLLAAAAVALFLPGWLYGIYRLARQGPPPATPAARERYLAAALPLYPAVRYLNRSAAGRQPEGTGGGRRSGSTPGGRLAERGPEGRSSPCAPEVRSSGRAPQVRYCAYGLFAENMKYFAKGTLLGDWNGPLDFDRVASLLADPERLYGELRGRGVDHLLIHLVEPGPSVRLPDTPAARRRFRLVYSDRRARIYALR